MFIKILYWVKKWNLKGNKKNNFFLFTSKVTLESRLLLSKSNIISMLRPVIAYGANILSLQKVNERRLIHFRMDSTKENLWTNTKDSNNDNWKIVTNNGQEIIIHKHCLLEIIK